MKKWYATINGDDNENNKKIKLGVIKTQDDKKEVFEIIANNGDELNVPNQKSLDEAIYAIKASWGAWKTFEWVE
jgi:predicted hydrolase (HD superfamily)